MAHMTVEVLRDACKKNGGYAQPTLNDQLFLQCRGFSKIENLAPYINMKVLWLEQNGISTIEGLEANTKLVSLFLQNNAISRISGLSTLSNLRILNLSHNYISTIEGLANSCPFLETLQISHNQISSLKACEELWGLKDTLSSVDLSFNKIEVDADAPPTAPGTPDLTIVNFFQKLPNCNVIYLHGNPLTHGMRNYRKNMIVYLPQLTYLDERPVFPDERRTTEAWGRGGEAAESEERKKIKNEKREELTSCVENMTRAMEANRETRDKLTKQWEERREEEREALRIKRLEQKKQQQSLDSLEYDRRGGVEIEESDAWFELESDMETAFAKAMREEKKRRHMYDEQKELDEMRIKVDAELREQEERIAEVLARAEQVAPSTEQPVVDSNKKRSDVVVPPPSSASSSLSTSVTAAATSQQDQYHADLAHAKAKDTMDYWIRQLDQSDEEVLSQMEHELQSFLSELEPGLPPQRGSGGVVASSAGKQLATTSSVSTTSGGAAEVSGNNKPSSSAAGGKPSKMSRAVSQAVAVTAATLRDGKPKSSYSREALWETYYNWETRNQR